ncbi:MAG: hypothetical protein CMH81_00235 [Nitrospiraceae bacterium]|nr:hypothetical protein [Nitrospiraceae bacterium]|tara:strand:+ start:1382 stop:1846 length:465 start_codon:yes stop_codon:yes gene_type:complete
MLQSIKAFFQEKISAVPDNKPDTSEHALQLATAALLIEIARADFEVKDEERHAVTAAIQSAFQLSSNETATLIALAEEEVNQATDMFQFAALINEQFPRERKILVLEYLWTVAFADADLEKYEEHLIRKVTTLLHLDHKDFIDAKLRVKQQLRP